MIHGYPFPISVVAGEELRLHVSTTYRHFTADFFLQSVKLIKVHTQHFRSQGLCMQRQADEDWKWPAYVVSIPVSWVSGVYIVRLRAAVTESNCLFIESEMLFVVRNQHPTSKILFKVPIANYHAYNALGGGSLYETPLLHGDPPRRVVSFLRPGGGVGGVIPCFADAYRRETVRQSYYHWDAPFISWLLGNRFGLNFCTNIDIDTNPGLLESYSLLVVGAHDEYWSAAERLAVERFVAGGGNVAIFGGNTCWWRVHYNANRSGLSCDKGDGGSPRDQWWSPQGAGQPEDSLTGVSYRNGGGWWEGYRTPLGYVVQDDKHWIFESTGLTNGDCFGADTWPPLVGYECDGAPLSEIDDRGRGILHCEAQSRGTPANLEILGLARLGSEWQDLPAREENRAGEGIHAATMITFQNNGTVFNAASTDWISVLITGQCSAVDRITRNVLVRLSKR